MTSFEKPVEQSLLGVLLLGDVGQNRHEARQITIGLTHSVAGDVHPKILTRFAPIEDDQVKSLTAGDRLAHQSKRLGVSLG